MQRGKTWHVVLVMIIAAIGTISAEIGK